MENTIVKRKWFWAWQDDKEEEWLSDMSKQGYHLSKPGFFGRYEFEQGESRNYVYRLDFMSDRKVKKETYLQFFADAGWEYIGEFGSWQYFRILAEGEHQPEIYTDVASKIKKYERILVILVIFQPTYLVLLNVNNILQYDLGWFTAGIFILWLMIVSVFTFGMIKLIMRIQELKKTIKQ